MNKLAKLIAAVHASVLVSGAFAPATAQDAAEVRAYMEAVRAGTPEALAAFLRLYPSSVLPGSELGARIAASIGDPAGPVASEEAAPAIDRGPRWNRSSIY